jgi:Mn-dependent DtxR family transcriptional regulator
LCGFGLLPAGFTNRDLRTRLAVLLDVPTITSGQMTYDLRRLRAHGLIERVPGTFRYTVTDTGARHARFLTRVHDRIWRAGLAQLTDPDPPRQGALRQADRAYHQAIDQLISEAGIAA